MNLRLVGAIVIKDLLEALRSLRLLAFVLLPVGLTVFYRLIFASAGDVTTVRVVIYDAGHSRLPQVLAQMEDVRLIGVGSIDELQRVVLESKAVGGMVLPPDYDAALRAGSRPSLRLYANGQLKVSPTQFLHLLEPALRAQAGQQSPARLQMVSVNQDGGQNARPVFDLERFMLVMFVTMGVVTTAVMVPAFLLVEEKEQHTLSALLISPASLGQVVVAKGLTGLGCALLAGVMILAIAGGLGGKLGLTLLALFFSTLFLVGLGLLLGVLFESQWALNAWGVLVLLPLTLPGVLVPAADLGLLQTGGGERFLRAIPTYYLVDAIPRTVTGVVSPAALAIDLLLPGIASLGLWIGLVWLLRRWER